MPSRSTSIRILFGLLCVLLCASLYIYLHADSGSDAINEPPPGTLPATDSARQAAQADSVPDEFARLFRKSYSFDTVAAADRLIIDTSVQALPSGATIGGRRVTISICGVDSRLNERVEHADANHVVTVWLDSGVVEITSIPRDTPCDAGIPASRGHNNLSNLRAHLGRDAYLHEVAAIAGVDSIDYYIELGFSQARGLLELLGFRSDAGDALRVLRSRRAFNSGDFQRSFNQGEFIRQGLLGNFSRLDGVTGNLLLRAGLYLVSTNLTVERAEEIVEALRAKGFPKGGTSVTVCIRPEYYAKMAVFNFGDSAVLGGLLNRINRKAEQLGIPAGAGQEAMMAFRGELQGVIAKAVADSAKLPVRVVANLRRCFEQRIWWQLPDARERGEVRRTLAALLANAYDRIGRKDDAGRVREILRFEEETFAGKVPSGG